MLSQRMTSVSPSPTMKVAAEAERLRRQGIDIGDLGAGEPDFPTPAHVVDAARQALDAGFTKYTTNAGIEELRSAVCARYRADYGIDYTPAEVIVTAGGKQALYNTTLALFGAGAGVARLARTLEDDQALAALATALDSRPSEPPRPGGHSAPGS